MKRHSFISGVGRPSNIAFAFAARTRNWEALGPAPQSTDSFIKSNDEDEGRVAETILKVQTRDFERNFESSSRNIFHIMTLDEEKS